MAEAELLGGIDLGGTKVLSICLGKDEAVQGHDLRPTHADRGPDAVIDTMVASLEEARAGRTIAAAGVSTPGPCNPELGIVTEPPNLPGWHDVPLAALLLRRLGVPVWIENDANAAALAEHRLGVGRGSKHMLLLTLGTGIGGGLILDGRLYHGASGAAGELGHVQLEAEGPLCGCGRRGCLEALASGSALEREAWAIAALRPQGLVATLAAQHGLKPDARVLEMAADAGDREAEEAILRAGRYLGSGLASIVNVFNPEVVVIGGSLRKLGERYLGTAQEIVKRDAFAQSYADVRFAEAELGDEAPAIGAALIARERLGL
jgi:glucokinase